MDENICRNVTAQRLSRVAQGYTNRKVEGKPIEVQGLGGGFRFCTLGDPLFDERGKIGDAVKFQDLASHVFFVETGAPIPKREATHTPLLGTHNGTAVYLLYNGILGDRAPLGGNILTRDVLAGLPPHEGPKVVYGAGCLLSRERLKRERITFRQIPYEVRVS
jgi:hypothetical protein